MNKYIIKLVNKKQLLYKLIYAFNVVKLEIFKVYIKIYLKSSFITFKFFY